jgi:hypothetical protein
MKLKIKIKTTTNSLKRKRNKSIRSIYSNFPFKNETKPEKSERKRPCLNRTNM